MKEPLKKRIESIEKQEGATEKFMYLCGIIGIVDIVFGILSLYLHFWIAAGIFFLIAVRQAIVFPKWLWPTTSVSMKVWMKSGL